jgi:hypothetical protein
MKSAAACYAELVHTARLKEFEKRIKSEGKKNLARLPIAD